MLSIFRGKARIGFVGVGHHVYWPQFPDLKACLLGHHATIGERIADFEVELIDAGLIDESRSAETAARQLAGSDIDLLLVDMLTYATSATFMPLLREINKPIVLLALQPLDAMNYQQATTRMQLENDNDCSLPEFTGVALRAGRRPPPCIIGTLHNDARANAELEQWCRIANVLHDLRGARIGHIGHSLEHMYDMDFDPATIAARFGVHVVNCEPDDIIQAYHQAENEEVRSRENAILDFFDTPDPGADEHTSRLREADLREAARCQVALEHFIEHKALTGLAYYYEGAPDSEHRRVMSNLIVGNSLLTAQGFPMCGESDLKTCLAMLIMDRLGIGGSFAEFHPIDFAEGFILVGHDGPHHVAIAEGKPVIRSLDLYHGKPGSGASVEFQIKVGPMTMLSINQTAAGSYRFIIAEGESRAGAIPATGNTNTRGFFAPDPVSFLKRWLAAGPTHHFALGTGHHAAELVAIAECLGMEAIVTT